MEVENHPLKISREACGNDLHIAHIKYIKYLWEDHSIITLNRFVEIIID